MVWVGRRAALLLSLSVLAGAAGYLVAADVPSDPIADRQTVEPGQARLVTEPTAITVEAAGGEGPGLALVYDANRTLVADAAVNASTGPERVVLAGEGPWGVLVPASSQPVRIDAPGDRRDVFDPVDTLTRSQDLADGSGGVVDRVVALDAPRRPASIHVAFEGETERPRATVQTANGTALELGPDDTGQIVSRIEPRNLTASTYRTSLHVDRLAGNAKLEMRTIQWPEPVRNESVDPALADLGAPVGQLQEGQALLVDTQGTGSVTLAVEAGGWASLAIYDAKDRVVRLPTVGHQGPTWTFGGDEAPPPSTTTVSLSDGRYVLYGRDVEDPADRVHVVLEDREDAHAAQRVETDTSRVQMRFSAVPEQRVSKTVRLQGTLVGLDVVDVEGAGADRRVVVDGQQGQLMRYQANAVADGVEVEGSQEDWPDRYGAGQVTIDAWSDGSVGSVTIEVATFTR
jgi:hypothetical protein